MVKTRLSKVLAVSALSLAAGLNFAQAKEIETNTARLQAMDKMTGKVSVIEVPVNGEVKFGSFSIVVRACKTRPPEEMPDNFAFVDVVDEQQDGSKVNIFKGWMISSSPALHAVEHPIYDVWLLQCIDTKVDKSKLLTEQQLAERDIIEQVVQPEPKSLDKTEDVVLLPKENPAAVEAVVSAGQSETETKEPGAQVLSSSEKDSIQNGEASPAPENIVPAAATAETAQQPAVEKPAEVTENGQTSEDTVFESEESYTEDDAAPQPLAPFESSIPAAAENEGLAEDNSASSVGENSLSDEVKKAPEDILKKPEVKQAEDLLPAAAEQEEINQPQPLLEQAEEPYQEDPGQLIEFNVDESEGKLDAEALR